MLKAGSVLGGAAALGLLGNVLCSSYLEPASYGQFVAYFASVSILAVVSSLGFSGYCIADQLFYSKYSRWIAVLTLIASALLSLPFFWGMPILAASACSLLLITTTLSGQGVLGAQIKRDSFRSALFQASPALVKGGGSLCLPLFSYLALDGKVPLLDLFYSFLAAVSFLVLVPLGYFVFKGANGVAPMAGCLDGLERKKLFDFLMSALLSLSYNMAIPPIVLAFHGNILSAYVGIYQIFWSVNSLFLTVVVNSDLLPRFLGAKSDKERNDARGKVRKACFLIALLSVLSIVVGSVLGGMTIWSQYSALTDMAQGGAAALFLRSLSAAVGVELSSREKIRGKVIVQSVVFALMLINICLVEGPSVSQLIWIIVLLELVLLSGYLLVARKSSV